MKVILESNENFSEIMERFANQLEKPALLITSEIYKDWFVCAGATFHIDVIEERRFEDHRGFIRNEDTNLPLPVYQEKIPKLPFPEVLVVHFRDYYGKKRISIKSMKK